MADTDTQQPQTPDLNAILQQLLAPAQVPQTQPVDTASTKPTSTVGLLGEALAGGAPSDVQLTQSQREAEGRRALLNFGIRAMSVGPFDTLGQGIAAGLQGAQASQYGSEAMQANRQVAAQDWQQQQFTNQIEKLKTALPLLRAAQAGAMPNPLLGGTSAPPGTTPGTSLAAVARDPKAAPTAGQQANNPGNIMADAGAPFGATGYIPVSGGRKVAVYPDLTTGIAANAANLASYAASGVNTVHDAVTRWVGDPKADLGSYENDIAKALNVKPTDRIDLTDPSVQRAFILAQQPHETGKMWFTPADVDKGVALAQAWRSGKATPPAATAAATPPADGKPPPAAPGAAPGAVTAANAPPGVQVGGPAPPPPDAAPGAPTGPAGGIGLALNPPAPKAGPIPVGKLQTTGKPPGQADAGAILAGMKTAQATPLPPGTVATAGPGAGTPPATTAPTPQPGWGTVVGSYGPATTTPPAAPAPQVTGKADQPPTPPPSATVTPPAPSGKLTFEQFQQQHPVTIDPSTYTLAPPNLAALEAAKTAAAQQLDLARRNLGGDPNKSLQDYKDAAAAVVTAQQAAQTKSAELQQAAQKNALDTQRQLYDAEMQRQQTAEENEKQRQADIRKAELAAGYTMKQKQADADITQGNEAVKNASDNAAEARKVISVLQSIDLKNLPQGAVAAYLDAHPDAAGWLRVGGLVDPQQAGAAQLLNAARSYLSLILKPVGTGALRNQEMSNLMAFTPSMLQDPDTQQEMLARLKALNRRAIDEYDFTSNYFGRTGADGQPVYDVRGLGPAMDAPPTYDAQGNKTGGGLGPLLPEPPALDAPRANHEAYQKYVQRNVAPGMPYVTYEPQIDPQTKAPARDQNGNVALRRVTKVRQQ